MLLASFLVALVGAFVGSWIERAFANWRASRVEEPEEPPIDEYVQQLLGNLEPATATRSDADSGEP